MKRGIRIFHWTVTILVCLLMTASATTYVLNYEEVRLTFEQELGFPTWLIYPMAVAKYSAVVMLLTKFNRSLTEWAYAGLTFNMLLAIGTHVANDDDQALPATVGLLLIIASYFTWKRIMKLKES